MNRGYGFVVFASASSVLLPSTLDSKFSYLLIYVNLLYKQIPFNPKKLENLITFNVKSLKRSLPDGFMEVADTETYVC